ncbi:MAG TPA: hypothetical protein VKA64_11695, partial [Gammaproteobacteria bacterium]|nr:hypothetical protein [Gammaproteobacteria bacterium]
MEGLLEFLTGLTGANPEGVIGVLVFLSVTLLVFGFLMWAFTGVNPVERRLQEVGGSGGSAAHGDRKEPEHVGTFLVRWMEPAGKIILPREDWQRSRLRT